MSYYTGCRPLSPEEEVRFLAALAHGVEPLREVALGTISLRLGLRLTEILSIRLGHLWDGTKMLDYLTVPRRSTKNKRAGKFLPLRHDVAGTVHAWIQELARRSITPLPLGAYLFPGRYAGTRLGRCAGWRIFKRAFKTAEISGGGGILASHTGRKTMAMKVWQSTQDVFVLRDCLGHADITTSQRYVQPLRADVERALLST